MLTLFPQPPKTQEKPLQNDPVVVPCDGIWLQESPETAQNTAEWFVLELLKLHPARTMDPAEAELFYVPILPVTSFWAGTCEGSNHTQRMVGGTQTAGLLSTG